MACYRSPVLAPFPERTTLESYWHPQCDEYRVVLLTYYDDGAAVFSQVELAGREASRSAIHEQGLIRLFDRKLKLLQMMHWFNLAYQRGGYA